MNPREQGFLLLTSRLGNPERKPLTLHQFRVLSERISLLPAENRSKQLEKQDLMALGLDEILAERILCLLEDRLLLETYLRSARKQGCVPLTRVTDGYPLIVRRRLGRSSPGCLWAKGDLSILNTPTVSLVGSRELKPENRAFAAEAGKQAALQGYTLVSGNAKGADSAAQNACLKHGGKVISVVADALTAHPMRENVLYLSEDAYEESFSTPRALSRNRVIHALGNMVFVAQCTLEKGGTWDGTTKNLHSGWSSVFCFDDGSKAARELEKRGAQLICMDALTDFSELEEQQLSLL